MNGPLPVWDVNIDFEGPTFDKDQPHVERINTHCQVRSRNMMEAVGMAWSSVASTHPDMPYTCVWLSASLNTDESEGDTAEDALAVP